MLSVVVEIFNRLFTPPLEPLGPFSGIVHVSLTCIWITLLLVVVLLGIGAIYCPMARLVAVLAWHVARWNAGASLSCATIW